MPRVPRINQHERYFRGIIGQFYLTFYLMVAQMVKDPPAMQEIRVPSPGWVEPIGEGNDYPRQYSCLENPMDRGAWWAIVHSPWDRKESEISERLTLSLFLFVYH